MQVYSDPTREQDPHALPNVEVFYLGDNEHDNSERAAFGTDDEHLDIGWYWWYCFPGCLPESNPYGPFDSAEKAIANAREMDL